MRVHCLYGHAAPAVLGIEFCDRFGEAIFSKKMMIKPDYGRTIPIIRRLLKLVSRELQPPPSGQTGRHNSSILGHNCNQVF